MASGIVDCKGKTIMLGDRIRTPHGDVIDVCGGMVSEHKLFISHQCEVVDKNTPLTNTGHVGTKVGGKTGHVDLKTAGLDGGSADGDCIVWGG